MSFEFSDEFLLPSIQSWQTRCIKIQNEFFQTFSLGNLDNNKFDTKNNEDLNLLCRKLYLALYCPPTVNVINDSKYDEYDSKKEKVITKLKDKIISLNKTENAILEFNIIYVGFWFPKGESMLLPIFRIHRCKSTQDKASAYFVEPNGRIYKSWKDFIKNNKFPKCILCYPIDGWYKTDENGLANIVFEPSAACGIAHKLISAADKTITIVNVAGIIIGVAGLAKAPLASFSRNILAGTIIYGGIRSIYNIYDRIKHKESINPFNNQEAFYSWLSISGSFLAGISTVGAIYLHKAGIAGKHVAQSSRIAFNTVILGYFGIYGIAIISNVKNIYKKFGKNSLCKIKALEVFQLTASILFFTNNLINFQSASGIIKNAQKSRLSEIRSNLEDEIQKINFDKKILLDRMKAKPLGKTGEMHGAEITIINLNKLMKENSKWNETFGKPVHPTSSAAIHTSQPTHLAKNTMDDLILRKDAILKAQYSHKTRYDGMRINQKSKNTILAIAPHELDLKLSEVAQKYGISKGDISLPGFYYGFEIKLEPEGIYKSDKPFIIENPKFYFNGNKATHYFDKDAQITYLQEFPPHIKVEVNLNHRTPNNTFYSTVFYNNKASFDDESEIFDE